MTGSLQIKNDKFYMVLNSTENGKRKQKWISTGLPVKGNKRKAEQMLRETLRKYETQAGIIHDDVRFSDYIRLWLEQTKKRVDEVTYQGYDTLAQTHILPYFDALGIRLQEVTTKVLQAYFDEKRANGRLDGKGGLSPKSLRLHKNVLFQALTEAVRNQLLSSNPCQFVQLPQKERKEAHFYSAAQMQTLFAALQNDPLLPLVKITAIYGLRRSELLGLQWDSIDEERGTLSICHTVVKVTSVVEKDKTKNRTSRRTFPLTPEARAIFAEAKRAEAENRRLFGADYTENPYVFKWDDGHPYSPDYISHRFNDLLKKHGLPHIRFHEIRHPYVKHTTKIFSLRLMGFQAQAYPDARRKTRGACQLHRGGQSRSPVRPLCNRKRFSCLPPQAKMSWILYAISMRLSGYTSTRSISSSASSVVSVSASKIALDAFLRLSCRACSSCFCFACANTAA